MVWLSDLNFCVSTNKGLHVFSANDGKYIHKCHSLFNGTLIIKNIVYDTANEVLYVLNENGICMKKRLDNFCFIPEQDSSLSFSGMSSLGEYDINLKVVALLW